MILKRTNMKPAKTNKRTVIGGVTVVVPDTVQKKMDAIVALSVAVRELAKAINGVNVAVEISHCDIAAKGTGISIGDG